MTDPAFQTSILDYRGYRYAKAGALVSLAAVVAYWNDSSPLGRYGGTPTGLALGVGAAGLVLWLTWFGVRKRRYASRLGTVAGWLSAHVYLGLALVVVAVLHTGFQGGVNVHTLAFALMLIVIASGMYGVYAYARYPAICAQVMGEETLDTIFLKAPDLDLEARRIAMRLPDDINRAVLEASQQTRIGGGVLTQLRGVDPSCPTTAAAELVRSRGASLMGAEAEANRELYSVLVRKQRLLERGRAAVMYKARLSLWLYAHVPLALALLIALAAHVLSVFFYRA